MHDIQGRAKWFWNKARRRAAGSFYRRFFRESNHDLSQTILLAGAARSGTSWLAELISSQLSCRIMFEPFNWEQVDVYRHHFPDFQYKRVDERDPALREYANRVFRGHIRHPWIDREVNRLRTDQRLIKEVRANLFLKWLNQAFPQVPLLFIIRHPCAVVLSHLEAGWTGDQDIAAFLSQPALLSDYLTDRLDIIHGAETREAKLAVAWSIQQIVPRSQFEAQALNVVFYETLCREPQAEICRLFEALRRPYTESVFEQLDTPSRMTSPTSAVLTGEDRVSRWLQRLSREQVRQILEIVAAFDLDDIYGEAAMPLGPF